MKADTAVTITPALIEEWERDANSREHDATRMLEEAAAFRERAKAGRFLLGLATKVTLTAENLAVGGDGRNMTADIKKMANESPEPLSKKEVKKRLLAAGYPASKLTAYFYTPIHRLKETGQISVLEDGRIWKAP